MKRLLCLCLMAVMMTVALAACGKDEPKEVTAAADDIAKELVSDTVTSDTLTKASTDYVASTYFFDMNEVEDSAAYFSSATTACEVAVIKCNNPDYVKEVESLLKQRVDNQKTLYSTYNADEASRLDKAIIKTAGNYAVLCVSDDNDKADEILSKYGF